MIIEMKDGFTVEVDENCANDWSFLSLCRKIDKGDPGLIVDVAEIVLGGEDQVDKLAKHLEVDGRTSIDKMVEALSEIMESIKALKN